MGVVSKTCLSVIDALLIREVLFVLASHDDRTGVLVETVQVLNRCRGCMLLERCYVECN